MGVIAINHPITNKSFCKRVFDVHIGVGKKQTRQCRRSTQFDVLTIYPELPTFIASVNREGNWNMCQVFKDLPERNVGGCLDAFDSTVAIKTCEPSWKTNAHFPQ